MTDKAEATGNTNEAKLAEILAEDVIVAATKIGDLTFELLSLTGDLEQLRRVYDVRAMNITPPDGWPGKNAEERALAEKRARFSDGDLAELDREIINVSRQLNDTNASLQRWKSIRRGLEWKVRLMTAFSGVRVEQDYDSD